MTLAELARESTADAIMALRQVMLDAEAPASARIAAATALLDRAYGRPSPRVELDKDPGPPDVDTRRLIHPGDPDFEPLEPEPGRRTQLTVIASWVTMGQPPPTTSIPARPAGGST